MKSFLHIGIFFLIIGVLNACHIFYFWWNHYDMSYMHVLRIKWTYIIVAMITLLIGNHFMSKWANTHEDNQPKPRQ